MNDRLEIGCNHTCAGEGSILVGRGSCQGETVHIAGSVIHYQTPPTRNGNRVVYVILEDGTGVAGVTVFSDVQEKCGSVLFRESWLKVTRVIQRRGSKASSIIAEDLSPL